MELKDLSKKVKKVYKDIQESDTYEIFKDTVSQALTDATTEDEFIDMAHNSLEDYRNEASGVINELSKGNK